MKIKLIHAHFLISIGDYSNERVGFTAEPEEGDTIEAIVSELRQEAIKAVGKKAQELYEARYTAQQELNVISRKLEKARSEWEATAEFLKAQGLRTDAPPMPMFNNLLTAEKVESQSVSEAEFVDD